MKIIRSLEEIPDDFAPDDLDRVQIPEDTPDKSIVLRLGFTLNFFMRPPHSYESVLGIAKCADHYQQLVGPQLKHFHDPHSQNGHFRRLPKTWTADYVKYVEWTDMAEGYEICATFSGDDDPYAASSCSFIGRAWDDPVLGKLPSQVTATFPCGWVMENGGLNAFQALVYQWSKWLKPFQAQAGFGVIQSIPPESKQRSECFLYPLSQRFLGLDIPGQIRAAGAAVRDGEPLKMKSVNWLTVIDDECLNSLGGRGAVHQELGEGIELHDYDGGTLIQAGSAPQLGDVKKEGVPHHYQELARLLKPLRMTCVEGHSLMRPCLWTDKSGAQISNEWLARFD